MSEITAKGPSGGGGDNSDTDTSTSTLLGTFEIKSGDDWSAIMTTDSKLNIDVKGTNWSTLLSGLPVKGKNDKGETVYYTYRVEEVGNNNYDVTYVNNDGIANGTITIKNQISDNPSYELPKTGGTGIKWFATVGTILMSAVLLYGYSVRVKRARRKKDNITPQNIRINNKNTKRLEEMIMRIMKKAKAMVLSVVMMLAMCVTAFAAEGTVQTHKITAPTTNNHQYEIYQIFTGDYSAGELTNEKWGANGKETAGTAVDVETLAALEAVNNSGKTYTDRINVIKNYVNLNSTPVGKISNGSSYDAVTGYYLIKDATDTTYALYVVEVVNNDITITPKTDQPSFEKKIKDTNDTTGETSGWQDSADYDIGDQVPFKLEGTVTDNYADYKTYYFAFHDKEETGLTFNADSVKVYVDGKEITSGYEVVTDKDKMPETDAADKCTFEVVFNDLKDIEAVHAGSKITVEYTSTLNDNAVIGQPGNVNGAKLEYSNNPSNTQVGRPDTPGETPWDNVIVFTYKVVVNKVNQNNEALKGAGFTLSKVIKDGDKTKTEVVKEIAAGETTKFEFKGLDDGDYILEETTVPAGYNKIDAINFTVTADHKIVWEGENRNTLLTSLTGTAATGEIKFTANEDKSELATTIINKKGAELPSTGGIGTTIFYVIGGIMVLGAAVALITKKRMEADK